MSKRYNTFILGGNKGGVGKSTTSYIIIYMLLAAGLLVEIFDADKGNPDVAKMYKIDRIYNLHHENGFLDLFNRLGEIGPEQMAVISTPAGIMERAEQDGDFIFDALGDMQDAPYDRQIIVIWPIDNGRDGVQSLNEFMRKVSPAIRVDVLKNLHFGDPSAFSFFDSSNTKKAILARGGRIVELPALAERIAATIKIKRLQFDAALAELPVGERFELRRWLRLCQANFVAAGYVSDV